MGCVESTQAGAVPTWGSAGHRRTCSCPLSLHDQRRIFHLPLLAPCHPILMHQGCAEHQAAPLHPSQGRSWEGGVLQPPRMAGRLVGTSWGWQRLRPSLCAGLGAAAHPSPCSGDGSGTGQESCTLGTERPGRDKERDATNLAPVGVSMCPGRQEQGRRQAGSGWQGSSAAPCLPFPRSRAWRLTGSLQPLSGLTGSSLSPSPFA